MAARVYLALILALLVLIPALAQPSAHAQGRGDSANSRRDETSGKNFSPIPTPYKKTIPPVYLADCANPKTREDADLCQQMQMANAAKEALQASYWQLGIGIAAAIIGAGAAVFTGWAAWAASVAARETARSVDVQIRMEGPLLHIQEIKVLPQVLTIHPVIKNSGNTPAVLVDASVNCILGNWELPAIPVYGNPKLLGKQILEKGQTHALFGSFPKDEDLDSFLAGNAEGVVWGYVRYEDVFGRIRRRGFASAIVGFLEDDGSFEPLWNREGDDAYNYDREDKA